MTPASTSSATAVLLSGGGGNIGTEIALALAAAGRRVTVADLDLAAAERTAARVAEEGGSADAVALDVGSEESWAEALAAAGELGVLVNAAGVEGPHARLAEYPPEDFDAVMRINARGTFLGMRAVLPGMLAAGGGAVVNIASTAGLTGTHGMVAYVASKHAVVGLTRAAALEYGAKGIRVNAVCPGPTEGRMIEAIEQGRGGEHPERVREAYLRAIPMRRYGEPAEIAATVAFLASPEAGFVNGATLAVDGGMTAN